MFEPVGVRMSSRSAYALSQPFERLADLVLKPPPTWHHQALVLHKGIICSAYEPQD